MIHLVSAEWLKLRKRWMPRILLILLLVILGLLCWGIGASGNDRENLFFPRGWVIAMVLATTIGSFLWPILSGSWAGNEYGWGTIRLVLSRRPDRTQFVLSGILVLLAAVGVSLIAAMIVETIAGAITAALTGNSFVDTSGLDAGYIGFVVKVLLASWFVLSFYVVLAFAAGTLFRSGAVGIGAGIGIIVAELILRGILFALGGTWKAFSEHFPTVYSNSLMSRLGAEGLKHGFSSVGSDVPGIPQALIGLAIYVAVPLALALTLVRIRDVTA